MKFFPRFQSCSPKEYLVITGFGIKNVKVTKKAIVYPGQKCIIVDISANKFSFEIEVMTKELLTFTIPVVLILGPSLENDLLSRYCQLLLIQEGKKKHNIYSTVKESIEGALRTIVAGFTLEYVIESLNDVRKLLLDDLEGTWSVFGLKLYTANMKTPIDKPGDDYITMFSRKKHLMERYHNKLNEIDLARQLKEHQASTQRILSDIKNAAELREIENSTMTRRKRIQLELNTEIAKNRLENESKVNIAKSENEMKLTMVDADFYKNTKEVDAELYKVQKAAEVSRIAADSQALSIKNFSTTFDGNVDDYLKWKMLDEKVHENLAVSNAIALQGLKPNINIWKTSSSSSSKSEPNSSGVTGLMDMFQISAPVINKDRVLPTESSFLDQQGSFSDQQKRQKDCNGESKISRTSAVKHLDCAIV
ncbi:hypothetical protein BDK51DRAFT_19531 [Blyttiomyces helicus]|uniref:Band 7 domain-containing protein n=1 Tax=Blyttiomyces helicus TaxID=388810 RepID=A0A4P9WMW7_9FUNG|nr:hypothetical protein BDK51DRAFT_19531 [Blyttiomyces helicus]|eukprot:RKO94274.1 hypothetical protein BDK51DRAFT_19531 [Blyttiomyces helicus]